MLSKTPGYKFITPLVKIINLIVYLIIGTFTIHAETNNVNLRLNKMNIYIIIVHLL